MDNKEMFALIASLNGNHSETSTSEIALLKLHLQRANLRSEDLSLDLNTRKRIQQRMMRELGLDDGKNDEIFRISFRLESELKERLAILDAFTAERTTIQENEWNEKAIPLFEDVVVALDRVRLFNRIVSGNDVSLQVDAILVR